MAQISELRALLQKHDTKHSRKDQELEKKLPSLEVAISSVSQLAGAQDNKLNGSVSLLKSTYDEMLKRIDKLERVIYHLSTKDAMKDVELAQQKNSDLSELENKGKQSLFDSTYV